MMKKTLVLKVDSLRPELDKIRLAAAFIRKGGLVAFPTETVYGLGADAFNSEAILQLFKAKKRPLDNPPIVHVAESKRVYELAMEVPSPAQRLMEQFWPGPLTLILKRCDHVPDITVAGLDTIAVRMPRHKIALALIRESGCPVAAPSANLAGKPSPTSAEHVLTDLDGRIDVVLDSGPTTVGVESTVVDMTVEPPEVLRPGGTSYESLKSFLGKVKLNPIAVAEKPLPIEKVRSPGLKHKHYAPDADVVVVEGKLPAVVAKVSELARSYELKGSKVGILCTDETVQEYKTDVVKSLGSRHDLADVARNLFRLLREFDIARVDIIIAEAVPAEGLGLAVMNRLRKAAGYKIVHAEASQTK
jgi:L-threonylcarbamoyladenylate synthase